MSIYQKKILENWKIYLQFPPPIIKSTFKISFYKSELALYTQEWEFNKLENWYIGTRTNI